MRIGSHLQRHVHYKDDSVVQHPHSLHRYFWSFSTESILFYCSYLNEHMLAPANCSDLLSCQEPAGFVSPFTSSSSARLHQHVWSWVTVWVSLAYCILIACARFGWRSQSHVQIGLEPLRLDPWTLLLAAVSARCWSWSLLVFSTSLGFLYFGFLGLCATFHWCVSHLRPSGFHH